MDKLGFTVSFGNRKWIIRDSNRLHVAKIPDSKVGVYRVNHNTTNSTVDDAANTVEEHISLAELHTRLGHIFPAAAE